MKALIPELAWDLGWWAWELRLSDGREIETERCKDWDQEMERVSGNGFLGSEIVREAKWRAKRQGGRDA